MMMPSIWAGWPLEPGSPSVASKIPLEHDPLTQKVAHNECFLWDSSDSERSFRSHIFIFPCLLPHPCFWQILICFSVESGTDILISFKLLSCCPLFFWLVSASGLDTFQSKSPVLFLPSFYCTLSSACSFFGGMTYLLPTVLDHVPSDSRFSSDFPQTHFEIRMLWVVLTHR